MSIYDNAGVVLIPSGYKAGTTDNLYSVLPANGDGDFNATRGSSATRVNKDGFIESVATNVPRLDYPLIDGVVQDCPALLLEPQRTNILLRSEEFDNSSWVKQSSSVTANQIVSPDGSQTADLYTSSSATFEFIQQTISLTGSQYYTFSIFFKSGSTDKLTISLSGGAYSTSQNVDFNLTDKTHTVTSGTPTFDIVDYGNGWVRCSMTTLTTSTSTASHRILIQSGEPNVSTYYLWGGQVELGSYPTSYIKTTSGQVTRSADVCNGSGTSAEFNDSEGVLFAEISALANDSTYRVINLRGNADNLINFGFKNTSNSIYFYKEVNNVAHSPSTPSTSVNILQFNKAAVSYSTGTNYLWVNGFKTVSSTGVGSFSTSLSTLNFDNNSSIPFYGKTKQLMTFKTALTDSELETLTSWDSFNAMATGQLYTIE
jgi:hypothetical protein